MSGRNWLVDRFMAWFMSREGGRYDALVEERKRELLSDLSGTLVEIGSGTGPNLRHVPDGVRFVAIEPNTFMHPHFRKEAERLDRRPEMVRADAGALPFGSDTVDTVLTTLVLCSLNPLDHALLEIHRVLKPGGRFLFLEHVGAPKGSWLRKTQTVVQPVWSAIGDGCRPNRDTHLHLERAGFRHLHLEHFDLPLPLVSPHIAGVAEK